MSTRILPDGNCDLFTMNADGINVQRLRRTPPSSGALAEKLGGSASQNGNDMAETAPPIG